MINKIIIKNFRSIEDLQMEIKPITFLYGKNASGKSSILYAPFILRNIVLNPSQSTDGFSNLLFSNLGGFEQIVFNHKPNLTIEIGVIGKINTEELFYGVRFGKTEGDFRLKLEGKFDETLHVGFPYPANSEKKFQIKIDDKQTEYLWNGITVKLSPQSQITEENLPEKTNSIVELVKGIDMIPLKRGFSKPVFSPVPMTPNILSEDELATLLTTEYGYLKNKVSTYLKRIFNKDFVLTSQPGSSIFYLQTVSEFGLTSEIVNDGFGINQTVYLLSKILRPGASLLLIEEPEIHIHPTAQNKLVEIFGEIIKRENKILVISTHSEHMISSLLSLVAEGKISHDEVACYFCKIEKGKTIVEEQKVTPKGQIEGGLSSFMETEVEVLRKIMKAK